MASTSGPAAGVSAPKLVSGDVLIALVVCVVISFAIPLGCAFRERDYPDPPKTPVAKSISSIRKGLIDLGA